MDSCRLRFAPSPDLYGAPPRHFKRRAHHDLSLALPLLVVKVELPVQELDVLPDRGARGPASFDLSISGLESTIYSSTLSARAKTYLGASLGPFLRDACDVVGLRTACSNCSAMGVGHREDVEEADAVGKNMWWGGTNSRYNLYGLLPTLGWAGALAVARPVGGGLPGPIDRRGVCEV